MTCVIGLLLECHMCDAWRSLFEKREMMRVSAACHSLAPIREGKGRCRLRAKSLHWLRYRGASTLTSKKWRGRNQTEEQNQRARLLWADHYAVRSSSGLRWKRFLIASPILATSLFDNKTWKAGASMNESDEWKWASVVYSAEARPTPKRIKFTFEFSPCFSPGGWCIMHGAQDSAARREQRSVIERFAMVSRPCDEEVFGRKTIHFCLQ